jgi:hypothetical protein
MKKGIVIFAFNNQLVDYVKMAQWSARRIAKFLDLPTCLITNSRDLLDSSDFDKIILIDPEKDNNKYYQDYGSVADWFNKSRYTAYELTPYQETILLDADYVVNSNSINHLFSNNYDFFCHKNAVDISGNGGLDQANFFGDLNLPMHWATVIFFKKSKFAESIFYLMNMIKNNWTHYRNLYHISNSLYRNDFALSIALNVLNNQFGHPTFIPWNLMSVMPTHQLQQLDDVSWKIVFQHQQQNRYVLLKDQDFHALGKQQLEGIINVQ